MLLLVLRCSTWPWLSPSYRCPQRPGVGWLMRAFFYILLLLMDRKWPPTTFDLTDPRSMLGNKLSACHTHTHSNTVSNEAVKLAALFHLPLHFNPAVFPPARPGGLWEGDGFFGGGFFFGLTLRGQRRGEFPSCAQPQQPEQSCFTLVLSQCLWAKT